MPAVTVRRVSDCRSGGRGRRTRPPGPGPSHWGQESRQTTPARTVGATRILPGTPPGPSHGEPLRRRRVVRRTPPVPARSPPSPGLVGGGPTSACAGPGPGRGRRAQSHYSSTVNSTRSSRAGRTARQPADSSTVQRRVRYIPVPSPTGRLLYSTAATGV